ncbi:MAG: asparagine synthase (glutamine-hydrolyzing) [Planctomycetota bacterium]
MCGLTGKLWFDAARPGDGEGVARLMRALVHRGPDDEGLVVQGPVALGHRRLSIVDLSPRGRQPLTSTDGQCLLVCNGEIYNHRELRAQLSAAGHRFRSDSDNEVILPLYQEWYAREGPDFVSRLEGMFAFALWDARAQRLLLARDRVGKKPLLYALREQGPEAGLVFASELAALVRDPLVDRRIDWAALSDYLSFRVVPHPATAYVGARKLPPGSVLVAEPRAEAGAERGAGVGSGTGVDAGTFGRSSFRIRLHRTWRLSPGSDETLPPDFDAAADEILVRLRAAVSKRLMADVPLGAFLSGGLDSAAVVACMAELGAGPVRTFTIGFRDAAFDETAQARKVARHFGTEHTEAQVEPDALSLVDELVARFGEPFADSSAIPTLLVSKLARRSVKVVLTGDGGDESFAGYERYRALALAARLDRPWAAPARLAISAAATAAVAFGAAPVEGVLGGGGRGRGERLLRFAEALEHAPRRRNHQWRLGLADGLRHTLLTPQGRECFGEPAFYGADLPGPLRLNEALQLDVERYLPDDVLWKVDVATMAHGLEARAPFLDRQLMECAAALPSRYKLGRPARNGPAPAGLLPAQSKLVLRRALERLLPADLRSAPKRGFGLPLGAWLAGPLAAPARDLLLSPEARRRGLFRPEAVEAMLSAHVAGTAAAEEPLFTLMILERWFLAQEQAA